MSWNIAGFYLLFQVIVTTAFAVEPMNIYVSPDGNDAWSGSLSDPDPDGTDGPLATITGARDVIRQLKITGVLKQPVNVVIAAGNYEITEPLTFDPQDSGTADCPITYMGEENARPVISGGRQITNWEKQGHLWVTHLPGVQAGDWSFGALWIDGQRRTRARTPNEGYFYTVGKAPPIMDEATGKPVSSEKIAFRFKPGDIKQFENIEDAIVVVYQSWEVGHQRIAAVDEELNFVTFKSPLPWNFDYWGGNVRYYVENVPEALDAPGEWYLDRKTGLLSYFPFPDENPNEKTVIAPVAKQLIVLNGKPAENQFIENLSFKNLHLLHTDWDVSPQGHAAGQAACDFPGAYEAIGARNCVLENCELAHLGTYGAWLRFGSQDCSINSNDIHDLGAGGVRLGEQGDPVTEPETAQHNIVDNNFIHDGGIIDPGAVGVWIGRTSYNQVSHNEICDLNYTGISVGWSWGYAPTSAHHNIVEFNHIHNIGRGVLGDMGGIYCLGISPGTVIRNNLVHDVYDHHTGSLAIYTDEGSTGIMIENNIGYGTTYANFHQHYGQENIVRNNIWALGKDFQLSRAREEDHISFTFERNIVYYNNGKLLKGGWTNNQFVMDSNLYWDTSHPDGDIMFGDATLEQWQARGHDLHSLIADPMFHDAENFDFRLKPESPAFKLGFIPIDTSEIGLYGDADWVNAPKLIERKPYVPKPPAPPQPQAINEDFENYFAGMQPDGPVISLENMGDISVSDELAASGKFSLKFTDAPGQNASFNPHMWYTPNFTEGVMQGSFDLYLKPGAVGHFEWRTYADGVFYMGPSLRIEGDGKILSFNREIGQAPLNKWLHVEFQAGLGDLATGQWTLRIGPKDGELEQFELSCAPEFVVLNWFGFISDAITKTEFFVDNIKVAPVQITE